MTVKVFIKDQRRHIECDGRTFVSKLSSLTIWFESSKEGFFRCGTFTESWCVNTWGEAEMAGYIENHDKI